jgi:hypothetical protein
MKMRCRLAVALCAAAAFAARGAAAQCDAGLALDDADPLHGASAVELCDVAEEGGSGVVDAAYVTPDGAVSLGTLAEGPIGVGLLDDFGSLAPQRGARMLALSSGTARAPDDPGWNTPGGFDKDYTSGFPAGFPAEIPACPGVVTGTPHDGAALRLELRAPAGAESFSFRSKLHGFDFPGFVCTSFTDVFAVLVTPAPPGATPSPNVVFDALGNPSGANSSQLLTVCAAAGAYPCPQGPAELAGTGFEGHGATAWLETRVPIPDGDTFTIVFAVWDSGDGVLDSTLLLDDFRWSGASLEYPITQVAPEADVSSLAGALGVAALGALQARKRSRHSGRGSGHASRRPNQA